MKNQLIGLTLASVLLTGVAGCANQESQGGGGGDNKMQRAASDDRSQRNGNDMGDQLRANLTNDLTTEGRDFAEAYARMPWIHANLAAGDWERALDDLQFVNKQLDDLHGDRDISPSIKNKLASVKPLVAQLNTQIQKHDKMALQTSVKVLDRFAMLTNDPLLLAWIGDRTRGGGAGR